MIMKKAEKYIELSSFFAFTNATIGTLLLLNMLVDFSTSSDHTLRASVATGFAMGGLAYYGMFRAGKKAIAGVLQEKREEETEEKDFKNKL